MHEVAPSSVVWLFLLWIIIEAAWFVCTQLTLSGNRLVRPADYDGLEEGVEWMSSEPDVMRALLPPQHKYSLTPIPASRYNGLAPLQEDTMEGLARDTLLPLFQTKEAAAMAVASGGSSGRMQEHFRHLLRLITQQLTTPSRPTVADAARLAVPAGRRGARARQHRRLLLAWLVGTVARPARVPIALVRALLPTQTQKATPASVPASASAPAPAVGKGAHSRGGTQRADSTEPPDGEEAAGGFRPPPAQSSPRGLMNNLTWRVHYFWMPAAVDVLAVLYMHSLTGLLLAAGFQKEVFRGMEVFVRPGRSPEAGPPILCFHGISCSISWLASWSRQMDPARTIIAPRHPGLVYSATRVHIPHGQLTTTQQYAELLTAYLEGRGVHRVDVLAWSFGGYQRNYFSVAAAGRIAIRREVLVEPTGMPISNALAGTYNLLPFRVALERARQVTGHPRWTWLHLASLLWFRYHVHTRPLHTDPFFNRHMPGVPGSWNRPEVLILLSAQDILTPPAITLDYLRRRLPRAAHRLKEGGHGRWPQREEFPEMCRAWFDVADPPAPAATTAPAAAAAAASAAAAVAAGTRGHGFFRIFRLRR